MKALVRERHRQTDRHFEWQTDKDRDETEKGRDREGESPEQR